MLSTLSDPRSQSADLIQRVYDGTLSVLELYDAHVKNETKRLRHNANDPDLGEHVAPWLEWLEKRRQIKPRQRADYLRQVRTLVPDSRPFRRSKLTSKNIESWLTGLASSGSTQNRYFAALRSFVKYLRTQGILDVNPLEAVEPPRNAAPRSKYMPFEYVGRVLAAMPEGDSRAFIALAFGSGMERSALLGVQVSDVIAKDRTLLAPGTKNANRRRYVTVDRWAWVHVEPQMRSKIGCAPLFDVDYERVIDDFYAAQIAVGLVPPLPEGVTPRSAGKKGVSVRGLFHTLHDCRHTYAVNRMTGDDGEPRRDLQYIADQLGHSDLQMVSRIYARHRHRAQRDAEERHGDSLCGASGEAPERKAHEG
jgi:integrase